jgi:hypothetical protein
MLYRPGVSVIVLCLLCLLAHVGCSQSTADDTASTPRSGPYLGETPPINGPQLFAPAFVTTSMIERDVAMTPDGLEFYFCAAVGQFRHSAILQTRLVDGQWTEPEVAPFSSNPEFMYLEPHISPDGSKFYFMSNKPDTDLGLVRQETDIWVMNREGNGWGEPRRMGPPINTEASEYFPSVTNDGTMYFTRDNPETRASHIYRSRMVDGVYQEPEMLPEVVNCTPALFNAFIAPDESYLIVPIAGREDSYGRTDYYICYRNDNDEWSEPINLGNQINTPAGQEWSPYVSPDGKYFFFMSARVNEDPGFPESGMPSDAL